MKEMWSQTEKQMKKRFHFKKKSPVYPFKQPSSPLFNLKNEVSNIQKHKE